MVNTIARKEEKKEKTPTNKSMNNEVKDEPDNEQEELQKIAAELKPAPKGKRRFIDYLLNKKSETGSIDAGSRDLSSRSQVLSSSMQASTSQLKR